MQRHIENLHKLPATHFSILQEMSLILIGSPEAHGYSPPEKMLPDINHGKMFCDFLGKQGIDSSKMSTYRHKFPDGR
jgi:hypothetical protein